MDNSINHTLKLSYVRNQSCFSQLTADETEKLTLLFVEQHFSAGDTIVTEGDPVDSVFLIVSGKADVRHVTIKDHQPQIQSLAVLGPGEAIGLNETGFYSLSGVRTATVVAITNMVTLKLNSAEFHGFALMNSHVNEVMHDNAKSIPDLDFKIE